MAESSGGPAKVALLALMVLMAAVAVVVADDTEEAGASELATFASCDDLTGWMSDAQGVAMRRGIGFTGEEDAAASEGGDEATSAPVASASGDAEQAAGDGAAGSPTGATNVIVEGIDELDRIEQLDGNRVLAVGAGSLHLVDVSAAASLASVPVPPDAQISFDAARSQVWVAAVEGTRTRVTRLLLDGDAFREEGTWSSEGMLLAGRRTDGAFHVVLTQGFGGAVPFEDGPVPCDEVLHPTGPATPEATLLVTLPPTGALEPTAATEIVGAGQFVHLTSDAVFVATALWEATPATSLHRFDLATLAHTGSGRVEGWLLNEFALSLHEGNLRVAITQGGPILMAVDVDVAEEEPLPVEPGIGGPVAPEQPGEPLNEVVVLDTNGDLDVIGRSSRFGLPGETLQGIRFVGTTAYAVTFLQTDPFYVIDLADPASPRVVGEVKLPGFSSYLHPVADGYVVGFGPDGDGTVAAKLFDVTNPAAPRVADTVTLGQESPVAWDHHAYLGLGDGRFAVPAHTWVPVEAPGCDAAARTALEAEAAALEVRISETADEAQLEALYRELDQLWSDPCLNASARPVTSVVELRVAGGSLEEVSRTEVRSSNPGERVLRTEAAWAVYSSTELVVAPDAGPQVPVPLG